MERPCFGDERHCRRARESLPFLVVLLNLVPAPAGQCRPSTPRPAGRTPAPRRRRRRPSARRCRRWRPAGPAAAAPQGKALSSRRMAVERKRKAGPLPGLSPRLAGACNRWWSSVLQHHIAKAPVFSRERRQRKRPERQCPSPPSLNELLMTLTADSRCVSCSIRPAWISLIRSSCGTRTRPCAHPITY